MRSLIILMAFTLAIPATAADDDAPIHTLRVVNDTSAAVNQLFVGGGKSGGLKARVSGVFGGAHDDRDRLDAKMLPRGGSIEIQLGGKRCRYDLRAVLVDGRTYVADDFDICSNPDWTVASGRQR